MKGTITAIKRAKGFSFVRGEDGLDRFAHANSYEEISFDNLQEGMKVEFESYEQTGGKDNGLRARRIRLVQ